MKQLSMAVFMACALIACNTATTSTENTKDTTAATTATEENVTYAYTPVYSGDFTIGDSKNAQTVLDIWKDFDNNTLDNHKDAFADTVSFDSYDGHSMRLARDSMTSIIKSHRSSLSDRDHGVCYSLLSIRAHRGAIFVAARSVRLQYDLISWARIFPWQ